MMKRTIIIFAVLFCVTTATTAQTMTEIRQIRIKVIEIFKNYSNLVGELDYPDKDKSDDFAKLFDEDAKIYNDYLFYNQPQVVTPQEYCKKRDKNIILSQKIDNWKLGFPYYENEKWNVKIEYYETIHLKFIQSSLLDYPTITFDCEMIIEMEKNPQYRENSFDDYDDMETKKPFINSRIQSIKVNNPIDEYIIVENFEQAGYIIKGWKAVSNAEKSNRFRMYLANNEDVEKIHDKNNNYFYPADFFQDKFDNHFYSFQKVKKNLFGFGVNYAPYGLGNQIHNDNFSDILQTNNALSLSLFYGWQIAHKPKSTWFFNLGLDLSLYNYTYKGDYYTEYQAIDADNDPYLRKIKISDLRETAHNFGVSVPLSFQYLHTISNNKKHQIFLSFELGGFVECFVYQWNNFSFSADYTGLYNYFGYVEFDHYYDFGHFSLSDKEISQNLHHKNNWFDFGAFGKVGFWFELNENCLLKFDFGYKYGFHSTQKYQENFVLTKDNISYETMLQSTNQGLRNVYVGLGFVTAIGRNKIIH